MISHPYIMMSSSGGACWSADLESIVSRLVQEMCSKRFFSVGGSDMILSSFPVFCVYMLYLPHSYQSPVAEHI